MQKGIDTVIAVCYIKSVPRATQNKKDLKNRSERRKKVMKNYKIERYSIKKGTGDHCRSITADTDEQAIYQALKEYLSILQTERMVSKDLRLNLYLDSEPVISIDGSNIYRYGDYGTYTVPLQPAYYDQSYDAYIAKAINAYGYIGYLIWDITNANAQFDDDACDWDNPKDFKELEQI